jgi:hypothetical protein
MISRSTSSRFALAVIGAALLIALSVGSVLGGEVTGPPPKEGDTISHTPIGAAPDEDPHASSICSFSGLGDLEDAAGRTAAHVQNWGQLTKAERAINPHPGFACNGHIGFFSGGGSE